MNFRISIFARRSTRQLIAVAFCLMMVVADGSSGWAQDVTGLAGLIFDDAKPMQLASGLKFAEGPAADGAGGVFFTDVGSNKIYRWDYRKSKLKTIRKNSGGADGLFVDAQGTLWIAEIKNRRLSTWSSDGKYSVVLDSHDGEPLTGVNDLWIDPTGGIYFSDSYSGSEKRTADHRVFYRNPQGEVTVVDDAFFKSNGIIGTPDGRWLYVADYIANLVYRYPIVKPGTLGERTVFAEYRCDGMTLDERGNLYLCTGNGGHGIVVMDPTGQEVGKIELPEPPANACFGGKASKTLFVSATHGFYSLAMKVRGASTVSPQTAFIEDKGGLGELIRAGARPSRLAEGFRVAQGPTPDGDGNVLFSDITHHRIMKWDFKSNRVSVFREQSGGPDGLWFNADGSVWVCELRGRRFAKLQADGSYEIILDQFEGKELTGPNDVYVTQEGGVYFSDSYPGNKIRKPAKYCVYYLAPGETKWKRIVDDHFKTKGIHESLDRKWLYMADYGGRKVYRYPLDENGVSGDKELFIDRRCGGLTVDEQGNVYVTTVDDRAGLQVYNSEGKRLGKIDFGEGTTNATFAGPNRDQLVVTTLSSLFVLEMNVRGMR